MSPNNRSEVVMITGASAGIGRATAREFARHGACLGLIARGSEGLCEAVRECHELGGRAIGLPLDVTKHAALNHATDELEETFGPVDIWINNAMVSVFSPFDEMTLDEFERVTDVTYLGCVYGTAAALRSMKRRNAGTIVQVGSALAYRGIPLQSAYCGAKHAIQGFTESLRCELLHDSSKVHLTMVQMPAVNTPQFSWVKSRLPRKPQPVPPIYEPELAAEAIYWAAHQRRREVLLGMSTAIVVEANKMLPGVGDRYLALTGFDSQMTDEPVESDRVDNLWRPVSEDRGARGAFTARAHRHSLQFWATKNRNLLLAAGLATGAFALLYRSRGSHSEM